MNLFVLCVVSLTVCELFGETIRNIFGCGCYFVVECYGSVECGEKFSVEYIYGLCVSPDIVQTEFIDRTTSCIVHDF